jgi:hypothetical protein
MDSNGNFYGNEAEREALARIFEKAVTPKEEVRDIAEKPADAIDVDMESAEVLATMNRRQRMVFYSERRHGKSCEEAMQAARESLPLR